MNDPTTEARFIASVMAMQGILAKVVISDGNVAGSIALIAELAVKAADALLAELAK